MALTLNGSTNTITPVSAVQPAGSILQVVHATTTTLLNTTTEDTKFDTNLTAAITPTASSSKILVIVSQSVMVRRTNTGSYSVGLHLLRDSTVIIDGLGSGSGVNISARNDGVSAYNVLQTMASLHILDSPNTTSATTYKTQIELKSSSSTMKCQDEGTPSFITLMEVAA